MQVVSFESGASAPLKRPARSPERVQERQSLSYQKFPLSIEGEGDTGGEGASNWAEKPKSEAEIEAFEIKQP